MDGDSSELELHVTNSVLVLDMSSNRRLLVYGVAGLATLLFFVSIVLYRRDGDNTSITEPGSASFWPWGILLGPW